jgi:hypothetical protein
VNYDERQRAVDAEYLRAWAALSPAQLAGMKATGVNGPDCGHDAAPDRGRREVVGREDDAGSERHAGVTVDFAAVVDTRSDRLRERFGLSLVQAKGVSDYIGELIQEELTAQSAQLLARIVGYFLLSSENLMARAHGLAHAARMSASNGLVSLRHSAKICGCSPEWMRRVAWKWCVTLDLPPLEGAKSPAARAAYSKDKLSNHYRKKKCTLQSLQAKSSKKPSLINVVSSSR